MQIDFSKECAMKIDFGPSSFNIQRDGVVLLHEARGARVVCVSGALWLTQDDDAVAWKIKAGWAEIDFHGTLLQAVNDIP